MMGNYEEENFIAACVRRDAAQVAECIAGGMKVNKRLKNGSSPLLLCVQSAFPEAVSLLCAAGTLPDQGVNGTTPLLEATALGDVPMMRRLLDAGARPDTDAADHTTPLMVAARKGFREAVQLLLERGAAINKADKYQWTPLHEAAAAGYDDCVALLLEHGANPLAGTRECYGSMHLRGLKGFTPLHYAAWMGHTAVVRRLLACTPVDIRATGKETPLMFAAQGNTATMALLLEAGADIEAVSRFGCTPLDFSVTKGILENIRFLLEAGANPNTDYEDMGPPIGMAAQDIPECMDRDKIAIIRLLLEHGADINLPCKENGATAIYYAICAKDARLVRFLLENGARDHVKYLGKYTMRDIARIVEAPELIDLLQEYGQ